MRKNLFVIILLSFFYCFQSILAQEADTRPVIKVGWIGPLTGEAAFLGIDSVNIIRDQFERANRGELSVGYLPFRLKLVAEDDQYNTSKALSAYNKLRHSDKINIFIALTYGAVVSFSERFAKDDVIIINPLDCDQEIADLADNIFCIAKTTEHIGQLLAEKALELGVKRPAVFYDHKDPFQPKVAQAVKDTFQAAQIKPAVFTGVISESTDFKSVLLQARNRKADALFVFGNDGMGLLFKQARELGIKAPFYSLASVSTPGFRSLAQEAVNNTITVGWFAPRTEAYAKFRFAYRQKYGRELLLEVGSVPSYDVGELIAIKINEIYDDSNKNFKTKDLVEKFYQISNYQGLAGNITIDEDGVTRTLTCSTHRFVEGEFLELKE